MLIFIFRLIANIVIEFILLFKYFVMVLSNKDLQVFYGCSSKTAVARRREVCDYFRCKGVAVSHVSVYHLAEYEGLPMDVVRSVLFD